MVSDCITLKCNAKITPYLAVGPYYSQLMMHKICGLLVPIDLHDVLSIGKSNLSESSIKIDIDDSISVRDKNLFNLDPKKNLIFRAINLIEKYLNTKIKVNVRLYKRIPTCGGLGGGSANAAATLIGVNELFQLGLRFEEIFQIAIKLGSDVPFFLTAGAKWVSGKGEILQPISVPTETPILLVLPPWLSRTALAYINLRSYRESNFIEPKTVQIPNISVEQAIKMCRNDLTLFHEIPVNPIEIRYNIQKQCLTKIVTLSGSGASWVAFNPVKTQIDMPFLTINSHICNEIVSVID